MILKDEGDFVVVGVDAGAGKLLPTDMKLPSKSFATKGEAFEFIKSLTNKPNQISGQLSSG